MTTLKKRIVLAVVLLISHLGVFIVGSMISRHETTEYFFTEIKKGNAPVVLGHYTIYRDIAANIKERKYDEAKHSAELVAGAMFDSLKECLADHECRDVIGKEVQKNAPEVLGEAR